MKNNYSLEEMKQNERWDKYLVIVCLIIAVLITVKSHLTINIERECKQENVVENAVILKLIDGYMCNQTHCEKWGDYTPIIIDESLKDLPQCTSAEDIIKGEGYMYPCKH